MALPDRVPSYDELLAGFGGVLAPALVALLGRFNWWLPAPVARLLRVTPLRPAAGSRTAPRLTSGMNP